MTEKQEIKIVTRSCITCQHEPEKWEACNPVSDKVVGRCSCSFNDTCSCKLIKKADGQCFYRDLLISDCPAWQPKVRVESDSVAVAQEGISFDEARPQAQ